MDPDPWRPSEYTAFLLHTLETEVRHLVHGTVLEIGVGSGAVLAALGGLGADRLVGTDIDHDALTQAATLLGEVGQAAELLVGDLWTPLAGRRFDLIVANPPQFATIAPAYPGRPPSWSQGGPDGRSVMNSLLRGLGRHLAPGGHAILAHNAFLGTAATAQLLAEQGLAMRRVASALMPLAPEKRAVMTPAVLDGAGPDTVRRLGKYTFIAADILDISSHADAGG